MKWLIWLLLLIPGVVNALTVDIVRKNESIEFINVLVLTATFGEFNCLSTLFKKSKFSEFLKVRSIDLNIRNIVGLDNLDYYETTIKNKIAIGNFDYIISIDEAKSFSDDFYDYMMTNFPKQFISISHNSNVDIRLFIDFNRFFLLLDELDELESYEIYYLHNKNNDIDQLYFNLLSNIIGEKSKLRDQKLMYVRDLTKLIDKVKNRDDVIFISNLDFLYDDVSGKIIYQTGILNLINEHRITSLNISHNNCDTSPINSAFYLVWDNADLMSIIDNIITQRRLEDKHQIYILPSKFIINLSLDTNVLKSPDVKKLKSLLEFTDDVIIKK